MYIIIKLLSYQYYCIIIFFQHERRGIHDPILVLINLISSSSSYNFFKLDLKIKFNNNKIIILNTICIH